MRHDKVMISKPQGLDFKATGYLISIGSVFFLGAVAWTKTDPPSWYYPVLIVGMAASILGMGFRYLAHIHEKKEIAKAKGKRG